MREELGAPLADEIRRQRLIDALAERWNLSVVAIEAAGGYGKSRAIAQAIRDNDTDPSGLDVYVRCRPTHRSPNKFVEAVANALGGRSDLTEVESAGLAGSVANRLSEVSPDAVCLHLDDVHNLTTSPEVIEVLVELVSRLPSNAHLVIAGRGLPDLHLESLSSAGLVSHLRASDLVFTDTELKEFGAHHGAVADTLGSADRWPAMARLALTVGPGGPKEFLIEEVIQGLTGPERSAIATAALAGRIDADLLSATGQDIDLKDLAARLPLLETLGDGWYRAHDMWGAVLDELVDSAQQADLVGVIAPWHANAGRHDEAIRCAAATRQWDLARWAVMEATALGDAAMFGDTTYRWWQLFPADQATQPEVRFLRGLSARLIDGPEAGKKDVAAALAGFDERGDMVASTTAAMELGLMAWLTSDVDLVVELMGRSPAERAAGVPNIDAFDSIGLAAGAEMSGDFRTAMEHTIDVSTHGVPRPLAELIVRHGAGMAFLTGDSQRGYDRVVELLSLDPSPRNLFTVAMGSFEHAELDMVLSDWDSMRYQAVGNQRDDFWMAACSCMVDAAFGITPDVEKVEGLSWGRTRERCYLAMARSAAAITAGDEAAAAAAVAELLHDVGMSDRLAEGEMRRFLPYGYVLSDEIRAHFESPELTHPLGPLHLGRRGMARIVVALRSGEQPDWAAYDSPESTFSALPLPWSVEVACGLMSHDAAAGQRLADFLSGAAGSEAHQILRGLATSSNETISAGAAAIVASLPAPPTEVTRLRVCGDVAVARGEEHISPSRKRVRQLLSLLALRRSISRAEVARLLWPEMGLGRARNNLSITLSHLRADLEPGRPAGEPTYHIRESGDSLQLQGSGMLWVDVWEIGAKLKSAASYARQGRQRESTRATHEAVKRWSGPAFSELRDLDELRAELEGFWQRLAEAGVATAEDLLADGQTEAARALAARVLAEDPFNEAAHSVIIAAHLDSGSLESAGEAIADSLSSLDELGVAPSLTTRMLVRRHQLRTGSRHCVGTSPDGPLS